MVARKKCRAPRRVRVTLDGGQARQIDPRVLEREHHEHDPEWTREAKPPKHRSDDAGYAAWGAAA